MYRTTPISNDPAAWRGADLVNEDEWTITLTVTYLTEIETAMQHVQQQGLETYSVSKADFALPTLSAVLTSIQHDLEGGRGFVRLRGLPVAQWSEEEARLALWGLGTHLGWAEPQDRSGNLIHDVKDIGKQFRSDDNIRYYQINSAIGFHTDGADIFALCCLQTGQTGGRSLLISAITVFNEIVRRRPDLAQVLQEDFYVDARGQRQDGARFQIMPIFSYHEGLISIIFKNEYIHSAQRFEEVPRLTDAQKDALDLLMSIMAEEDLILGFDLKPGDIAIASNHTVLHCRTAFEDDPDKGHVRHMLRLRLTLPNGRPLPPHYADTREFAATYTRRMPNDVV